MPTYEFSLHHQDIISSGKCLGHSIGASPTVHSWPARNTCPLRKLRGCTQRP